MAQKAVEKAIESYNHFRPHRSCVYPTAPACPVLIQLIE
ncbi:hypothetical protein [Siphonobacter sp. SORGH_AS_0500]|nr:hypothetical protein [Siphonobacter sp. SORGH_AS_0500]